MVTDTILKVILKFLTFLNKPKHGHLQNERPHQENSCEIEFFMHVESTKVEIKITFYPDPRIGCDSLRSKFTVEVVEKSSASLFESACWQILKQAIIKNPPSCNGFGSKYLNEIFKNSTSVSQAIPLNQCLINQFESKFRIFNIHMSFRPFRASDDMKRKFENIFTKMFDLCKNVLYKDSFFVKFNEPADHDCFLIGNLNFSSSSASLPSSFFRHLEFSSNRHLQVYYPGISFDQHYLKFSAQYYLRSYAVNNPIPSLPRQLLPIIGQMHLIHGGMFYSDTMAGIIASIR